MSPDCHDNYSISSRFLRLLYDCGSYLVDREARFISNLWNIGDMNE